MNEQPANRDSRDPRPEVLAEIDSLNAACLAAPGDIDPQIKLWQAVAALDHWVCINRGTAEAPRPYALGAEEGAMLCIFQHCDTCAGRGAGQWTRPRRQPRPTLRRTFACGARLGDVVRQEWRRRGDDRPSADRCLVSAAELGRPTAGARAVIVVREAAAQPL